MSANARKIMKPLNGTKAPRQSEKLFQALIENSTDAFVLVDPSGVLLYASPSTYALLGYSPEELVGQNAFAFLHPDDVDQIIHLFAALVQDPKASTVITFRLQHKDGTFRWVEGTGTNLLNDPNVAAIVASYHDITLRKDAELALQKAEERQRLLNEASNALVSSLDHQITLQEIGQMIVPALADYCRIAIVDEQQQIKEITVNHIHPEKLALVRELYEQYKDRSNTTHGLQRLLQTGKPELISNVSDRELQSVQDSPELLAIINALGLKSYMGTPLIARDRVIGAITFSSVQPERYYSHDDLLFAQELARRIALTLDNARLYSEAQNAIRIRDDFISIASHELKTPVTSLKMYTQVLQKQFAKKGEETLSRSLAKMDVQLNKLTVLIGDLLNVSKIELGQLAFQEEMFDLNEVVKETVQQMQLTTTKHAIRIEGRIAQPVWGDKERIGQVLTNLLSNAIKFSGAQNQRSEAERLSISSAGADTIVVRLTSEVDVAVVSVLDFGIGIEKEHLSKIFTRFYRVNDPEEKTYPGLGIGLYISYEIIKRHGGNLTVASEKGKGSLFSFTLPYQRSTLQTS